MLVCLIVVSSLPSANECRLFNGFPLPSPPLTCLPIRPRFPSSNSDTVLARDHMRFSDMLPQSVCRQDSKRLPLLCTTPHHTTPSSSTLTVPREILSRVPRLFITTPHFLHTTYYYRSLLHFSLDILGTVRLRPAPFGT